MNAPLQRASTTLGWRTSRQSGTLRLTARQTGPEFQGITATTSAGSSGAPPRFQKINVQVGFAAPGAVPSETLENVPREAEMFVRIFNGFGWDDPSEGSVQEGLREFYDYSGTRPLIDLPLGLGATATGILRIVSNRADWPLASAELVAEGDGSNAATLILTHRDVAWSKGALLRQTWRRIPRDPAGLAATLRGTAAGYDYAAVARSMAAPDYLLEPWNMFTVLPAQGEGSLATGAGAPVVVSSYKQGTSTGEHRCTAAVADFDRRPSDGEAALVEISASGPR